MLHRLVLIHVTACSADSQRGESQFECVWDVFTGHIGAAVRPQRNVLVLVWWCKTVINVCFLSVLLFSPYSLLLCPPTVFFALCLPMTLLLCPLSLSPSIILSTSTLTLSFHILYPTCLFFIFSSQSLFLFVLQASELGMTSAFYKYILTTMVRAHQFCPFLLPSVSCSSVFARSSLLLLLFCPFMCEQRC